MGFVGKIFKTIFDPDIPQASTQMPTVSARDLVSSTSSQEAQAPIMGSEDDGKRKRGINSLLVPNESIYKGGK